MSGPAEPSAGRAVKANQAPLGEYAADWPTSTTFWAISIAPGVVGEELTLTDGVGVTSGVGLGVRSGGVGVGFGVAVGTAVGVGVGGGDGVMAGRMTRRSASVGSAEAGGFKGTTKIDAA